MGSDDARGPSFETHLVQVSKRNNWYGYNQNNNKRSAAHAAINPQQATIGHWTLDIGYRYGYIYQGYYIYALVTPVFVLEGDLAHGLVHLLLFFSVDVLFAARKRMNGSDRARKPFFGVKLKSNKSDFENPTVGMHTVPVRVAGTSAGGRRRWRDIVGRSIGGIYALNISAGWSKMPTTYSIMEGKGQWQRTPIQFIVLIIDNE
jgi:hypothetical protein